MRTTCLGLLILLFCGSCKEQHDHGGRTPLVELDGDFLYHEDLQAVLPANYYQGIDFFMLPSTRNVGLNVKINF